MAQNAAGAARSDSFTSSGLIQARISDFKNGLRVFDDLRIIRITSKDYSLLIMEDYFPIIGQVKGRVELVSDSSTIPLGNISGFYLHRDNEFSLIIEEYLDSADEGLGKGGSADEN